MKSKSNKKKVLSFVDATIVVRGAGRNEEMTTAEELALNQHVEDQAGHGLARQLYPGNDMLQHAFREVAGQFIASEQHSMSPCRSKPATCGHFKTGQSEAGDS